MRTWIILFLCLIPVPAFAWQVGDLVTTIQGDIYQIDTVSPINQTSLTFTTIAGIGVTPCDSFNYYQSPDVLIFENGLKSSFCTYDLITATVHLWVPSPPPVPPVIGSGFGVIDFPTVKLLQPDNEYTAIFNYFFSLMFWFTLVLIPVKWTIRFFR